jgi:very-short-patch-repair endonuclease
VPIDIWAPQARTRKVLEARLLAIGGGWLPGASLEEAMVALWLQERGVKYMFQSVYGAPSHGDFSTDFQILYTTPDLVIEVQGDKWHQGHDAIVADRARRALIEAQGAIVVEVWGHAVVQYPGHQVPTDASFNEVMQAALRYRQVSHPL